MDICSPCGGINEPPIPDGFLCSEHRPDIIRDDFSVTGSKYGLVINRNIPLTLGFAYHEEAGVAVHDPWPWVNIVLTFAEDLSISTVVLATHSFPIVNAGVFVFDDPDNSEKFSGVFPETELNKLSSQDWVIAELSGDDDTLISRCVFKVLGGS